MSVDTLVHDMVQYILKNDVKSVESLLNKGDKDSLRHVTRHQISLADVFNDYMKGDALLAKLLQYEIGTLSALHLAAMLGRDDILMALLDQDIPVDEALSSGTTPLHMAAFADQLNTVNLLLTVYKADKSKTDKYGWTALHYASTEGHLNLVRRLVEIGVDVLARDQDGTTAAFRAQTNGHTAVVQYLTMEGDKTLMLTVPELEDFLEDDEEEEINAIYSRADGFRSSAKENTNKDEKEIEDVALGYALVNKEFKKGKPEEKLRGRRAGKNIGKGTIRRLVRKEIERALLDSDYLDPAEVEEFALGKVVGVDTMRGIMREELSKVRWQIGDKSGKTGLNEMTLTSHAVDDPPYAAIASLPIAPEPPNSDKGAKGSKAQPTEKPPALPPRNAHMLIKSLSGEENLTKTFKTDPVLAEAVKTITSTIGANWKKLAHNLPIDNNTSKIKEKIAAIEKKYPTDVTRQATAALAEWRVTRGKDATVDQLVIALRESGMSDTVPVVLQASQEFSA